MIRRASLAAPVALVTILICLLPEISSAQGTYNNGAYNNGQYNQGQYNNQQTVTCTTRRNSSTRKYCAADTENATVTLQRQTSNATCTQNQSWGYDDEGIWVSSGCGGVFTVTPNSYNNNSGYNNSGYNNGQYSNNAKTIRCTARNRGNDRTYCAADTSRGVQLVNEVSSNACTQDSTWGYDSNGIWVSRGCSADFQLGESGHWGRRHDRGQYGTGEVSGQTIRCDSNGNSSYRQYCPVDARGGVRMAREYSNNVCRQGSNWGYDNGGVWVSNGCSADFQTYGTGAQRSYSGNTTTIPAGTQVSIRADEAIDSKNAYVGQRYAADVAADVTDSSGTVIIPRGSQAELILHDANDSNYNNNANTNSSNQNLVLDLDSVTVNGQRYIVSTQDVTSTGSGIGANKKTGEYVGGGALLGAIIGAVAGGGKGAAIGAAVGAGAGAGGVILTKGHQVSVPVETVLKFKLDQDLQLRGVQ